MWHQRFDASTVPEYDDTGKTKYSNHELELMGELLLRQDARREMCRECQAFGEETGHYRIVDQVDKDGAPILTEEGEQLRLKFPEYICSNNHKWFKGEGKAKGTKGKNSFLLEEHLVQRRRREIHCENGTPDPSIVSGMYWKAHENGRQIHTPAERKERGLGFFK